MTSISLFFSIFLTITLTAISLILQLTRKRAISLLLSALGCIATIWFSYWAFMFPALHDRTFEQIISMGFEYYNFFYLGGSLIVTISSACMARKLRTPQEKQENETEPENNTPAKQPASGGGIIITAAAGLLDKGVFTLQIDEKSVDAIKNVVVQKIKDEKLLPTAQPPEETAEEEETEEEGGEPPLVAHEG